MTSNIFNYFYSYKYLGDRVLQWRVAMYCIAIELFLFSLYVWLVQIKKRNKLNVVLSGWLTIYLLINLTGVCLGFTLHTKGFMAILFTITFFSLAHVSVKLWQKYF